MDMISNLSDDLLLKILSELPTKDVVATAVLSKRWKFLWMMVHKLDFDDNFEYEDVVDGLPSNYERFLQFVDRVMVFHKAPVIKTLKFRVGRWCNTEEMAHWIRIGIVRCVRQLEISHFVEYYEEYDQQSIILPRSLYMFAKLEVLKLTNTIVLDVPTAVCLPSLKSLHLLYVEYKTDECHCRLLSGCPVLEELVVDISSNSSLPCFYVVMPSLERLSIRDTWVDDFASNVVINAPSLKYLNIVDTAGNDISCLSENMPKMAEANVNVSHEGPEMVMRSLTSVKRLSLCLSLSASMLQQHIVFYQLVHLELCVDALRWWELFTWMLESSPKLQVLKLIKERLWWSVNPIEGRWGQPRSVPECLLSHLNTFQWKYYIGGEEENKLVAYILKNARQLKTASFSDLKFASKKTPTKEVLVSLPRGSSSCKLMFD
ncbi:F-box domain [Arabidopsis suecica]|uniref:F-box domain n=1 Tax=Arabidopsis suecica TaxID=45249 RepID=A0A8T1Y057_ARASU|nr:F-box domain [Arabidopsis suecica]